jgi:hypothetical protein
MTDQTLDHATEPPDEAVRISNAGEFAAVWNTLDAEQRDEWFRSWARNAETAHLCVIQNHAGYPEQIQALLQQAVVDARELRAAYRVFEQLIVLAWKGGHGRELRRKVLSQIRQVLP